MKQFVQELGIQKQGTFEEKKSSAFNGRAFFPFYTYELKYFSNEWEFIFKGEYFQSEQSSRTGLNSGVGVANDRLSITAIGKDNSLIQKFKIKKKSRFAKLLSPTFEIKVKSENIELKKAIEKNPDIVSCFTCSIGPIESIIYGKPVLVDSFQISTEISPEFNHKETLENTLRLFDTIIEYMDKKSA